MKIWLLRPTEEHKGRFADWDCAQGFVIRAKTETRAREIAQQNAGDEAYTYANNYRDLVEVPAWTSAEYSTCVPLEHKGEEALVMRDFNAG